MMIKLHNIDCMDFMRDLPDKAYDLAIVDPPYGIGAEAGVGSWIKKYNFCGSWDVVPEKNYFDELFRVSKNQIIWGGNYFNLPPTRCFIVWDKGAGFKGRTFAECEMAWTSFCGSAKIFSRDPLANRDYVGRIHPTQKPVALYGWILKNYAKPGDKILDTHMGSGSIAIACHDLGFALDACELDADFFNAAKNRLEKYKQQQSFNF